MSNGLADQRQQRTTSWTTSASTACTSSLWHAENSIRVASSASRRLRCALHTFGRHNRNGGASTARPGWTGRANATKDASTLRLAAGSTRERRI